MFPETTPYRPKLLKKAPSIRAINNYYNLQINSDTNGKNQQQDNDQDDDHAYDNFTFLNEIDGNSSINGTTKVPSSEMSYYNFFPSNGTLTKSNKINSNNGTLSLYLTGDGTAVDTNTLGKNRNGNLGMIPLSMMSQETDNSVSYDYPTMRSSSGGTVISSSETTQSNDGGKRDEHGSTVKLVPAKMQSVS